MNNAAPMRARILIADDDLVVRRLLSRVLSPEHELRVVEDGAQAIAAYFEQPPPDLLMFDEQMPERTGTEALIEIRRRLGHEIDVPVLMLSGTTHPGAVSRALAAGVHDFFPKPFDGNELRTKVNKTLAALLLRRQSERQRAELDDLHARREVEDAAAHAVLERMVQRGQFDPDRTRRLLVPRSTFSGDAVFGVHIDDDRYRWMVADVTGHTLSSALVTIPISMVFYAAARRGAPLAEVIGLLERELETLLPVNMFCAAVLCELDRRRGLLQVWNGGMPEVLVRRATSADVVHVPSYDPPLAVARGITWPREVRVLEVGLGDRVIACSDGLIESCDRDGAMLGLGATVDAIVAGDAPGAFDRVARAWQQHVGLGRPGDDVSLVEVTV